MDNIWKNLDLQGLAWISKNKLGFAKEKLGFIKKTLGLPRKLGHLTTNLDS